MPALEEKRRRKKEIEDILEDHRNVGSQSELVELLAERGIKATQSSVSRDLQEMGVKRVKGRYVLKPWRRVGSGDLAGVAGFVMNTILAGPNLIVIQTRPGAAKMVADAIENENWPQVAGVIPGDDTLFIATPSEEAQMVLLLLLGTEVLPLRASGG
jgi:transcriptional regulator of arginine metabolism